MKTAEEILRIEVAAGNCDDITTNPEPDFSLPFYQDIVSLMKIYGRKCAEQALKDAAERATAHAYYHPEDKGEPDAEVDLDSILSTPIVTP